MSRTINFTLKTIQITNLIRVRYDLGQAATAGPDLMQTTVRSGPALDVGKYIGKEFQTPGSAEHVLALLTFQWFQSVPVLITFPVWDFLVE